MIKSISEKFWNKVNIGYTNECWEWNACRDKKGYGRAGNGKLAHRLAMQLAGYNINRLYVLHKCNNPICVNPNHLYLGSQIDNIRDRDAVGNTAKQDSHGRSVLSKASVIDARSLYIPHSQQFGTRALARRYGVSYSTMFYALSGEHWKLD